MATIIMLLTSMDLVFSLYSQPKAVLIGNLAGVAQLVERQLPKL
jgi:hypothetical protein